MFFTRITVFDFELGLRFKDGKCVGQVEPGLHVLFGRSEQIVKFDMRERQSALGGQEVMTKDGATVRLSMVFSNKIEDPIAYYKTNPVTLEYGFSTGSEADILLHFQIQIQLREWVAARTLEEAMNQRLELAGFMLPEVQKIGSEHGVLVTSLQLLDFSITGSLKSANADILKAEMEGKAAMQRTRNEASTLRSLINSAKLTQENPGLLELRILSSGQKPRVTFIVGKPDSKASTDSDQE
jgi:regulator of protease activity HflC (stomatin/prohibitin superfamily)